MTADKEGRPTERKGRAGQSGRERLGRTAEKAAGQGHDVNRVGIDPWGSFFEQWGQAAEGGSADLRGGEPKPAKGTRRTKPVPLKSS